MVKSGLVVWNPSLQGQKRDYYLCAMLYTVSIDTFDYITTVSEE